MRPWLLVPALGLSCAFAAATAQTYTVTNLAVLPDYRYAATYPAGVNESGQVTGADISYFVGPPGVPIPEAFLYRDGEMVALAGEYSYGYAITGDNRQTQEHGDEERRKLRVVGEALFTQSRHAFLYEDHLLRDLGLLPGGTSSAATAVNSFGEIAGTADNADGVYVAFLFRHGNMISLGTLPGGTGSGAAGINNWGDVTGVAHMPDYHDRAFLYHGGKMISLGTLPGTDVSTATAINDSVQITGTASSLNFEFGHAFLWSKGTMIDLGVLPNDTISQANSINAWGQVVGSSSANTPTGIDHAFLYSNGKMHDLNDMIPTNSGWVLSTATGINNRGQIVGSGLLNGVFNGFILSPDCKDPKNRDCGFCRHEF